jgi:uncharacterized protein YacL
VGGNRRNAHGQHQRLVSTEAFEVLLGLVIGVFFSWALVSALRDEGLSTFAVPVVSLVVVVVLAALAGVVAAVLPARRAARLDVLRALSAERARSAVPRRLHEHRRRRLADDAGGLAAQRGPGQSLPRM